MNDNLMKIEEAAECLSLSRSTIYELILAGEIPVIRYGRAVRIQPAALRQWVARQMAAAHAGEEDCR